jgi:hypothetical protein
MKLLIMQFSEVSPRENWLPENILCYFQEKGRLFTIKLKMSTSYKVTSVYK